MVPEHEQDIVVTIASNRDQFVEGTMKIQAVTPDLELNMAGSTVVIADSSGKIRFGFLPLFLFFCPSLFISELSFFCSYFMLLLLLLLLFFWFFLGLGIDCILTN